MRGGERLVQVDVHGIDAEIAGADTSDDGVKVRAVTIEIAACRVDQISDFLDVGFK